MKKRKVADGELHEIENKKRSRVVRDKKKGEKRLKPWTKKRKLRALLPVCLIAIALVSVLALGSFGNVDSNIVDENFVTVSYPVPKDGTTPLDHSALENIGYMNARFKGQKNWYSEMHGTTVAAGVNQSVNTFKQFSNDRLIMADVTSSSLVNAARQFCYVGDEVMWRNGTSYTANSFEEMSSIVWKTGEPYAHMTISDFKARNGLPGTELFVYVINEETLLDASEVIDNGDGTYTQSYVLDPARDKAPAHYVNQMKFTGGLTGLPDFSYIHLTYTFDSTWQVLSADVDEAYKAEMVITVNCTSKFHTDFSYDTPKAESPAFENYFKQYVGKGITNGELPATVDSMGCLTSAFLTKPVTVDLTLNLNGNEVVGMLYLDASKLDIGKIMSGGNINIDAALEGIEVRVKIGEISVYLDKGTAYIVAGDLKVRLTVSELIDLINRYSVPGEGLPDDGSDAAKAPIFAIDDPATEEPDDGFSYVAGESATMKAVLNLSSLGIDLEIPLNFRFALDKENRASLENGDISFVVGGVVASVQLKNSSAELPALSETEKEGCIDLLPYADTLAELFSQESFGIEINYRTEKLSVQGNLNLAIAGGLRLNGDLLFAFGEEQLPVKLGFEENVLFVSALGMKMRASVDEIIALVGKFTADGEVAAKSEMSIAKILDLVLKNDLLALLNVSEDDGALNIAVKGTELLKLFGIDFALGNVDLSVANGALTASALGANVTVTKGESVTVDKDGYIQILPYAEDLVELFTGNAIALGVNYEQNGLKVTGNLTVNMKEFAVAGNVTIGYQKIEKTVNLYYADSTVYLAIDGLKVKASVQTILDLVTEITGENITLDLGGFENINVEEVIGKILQLDFAKLIELSEENGKLCLLVHGTELLDTLGLEFDLGDIRAEIGGGKIEATVYGATVTVAVGTQQTVEGLDNYLDIAPVVPYIGELKDLFNAPALKVEVDYKSDVLSVDGAIFLALQDELKLSGDVNIRYGDAKINALIGYEDGIVYASVAGMKIKLAVEDIVALLQNVLPMNEEESSLDLQKLIDLLLSEETLKNFVIAEDDGVLNIAVKGTELLKLFGIDFALGNVDLSVANGALTASALGANVIVTKGENVTVDKDGYIEVLPYVQDLIDLFKNDALALEVNYEQNGLKVTGNLTVNMKEFAVAGNVTVGYQKIEKTVNLYYADSTVYLAIDGLKVKASVQTILDLVTEITGENITLDLGGFENINVEEVIGKILQLDFARLIELSEENGKLGLLVHGTELLDALGLEFDLGDIRAEISGGKIDATVYGATVTVAAGTQQTVEDLDNYLDIAPVVPYIGQLKDLFTSPFLNVAIDYKHEKLLVEGAISLALQDNIKLSGNVTVCCGEAKINTLIGYEGGIVYISVAGMKLQFPLSDLQELVGGKLNFAEGDFSDLQKLIDLLLSEETLKNFVIAENDGALNIAVKGTELLKLFGIDFALGNVDLSVANGALTASALGANVTVTKGENVTVDKDGYIEVLPYVQDLINLFKNDALALEVNYEQNGLKVVGGLTVLTDNYQICGTLQLDYKGLVKTVSVFFDGAQIYLSVDGLKACVGLDDVKAFISELTNGNTAEIDIEGLVANLLALDFSKLLSLTKTENKLELLVHGTELLEELGIGFRLGDLDLTVENGQLRLNVLGITLDVEAGIPFASDEVWSALGNQSQFVNIGALVRGIPQILDEKAISFSGDMLFAAGDAEITIGVENVIVSWKNGLNVYLDLRMVVNGTVQRFEVAIDNTKLQFAYGTIGVEIAFTDFADLDKAIINLYHQVRETADKILQSSNPMPEQVDGLLNLLEQVTDSELLSLLANLEKFDLVAFLKDLSIDAPKSEEGICTVAYKGFALELLNANDSRFAGVSVRFATKEFALNGALVANSYAGNVPDMPAIDYLEKVDLENLIDYLSAAVATLAETNLQVDISGEVLSTDTEKYPNGKKYEIKGSVNYYAGSSTAIHLNLDGKNLWVDSEVYMSVEFSLIAKSEADSGLYLELFLLDTDYDGVLDVYVSVSLLGKNSEAYEPLNIYARADELMSVLSSALAVLGVDNEIVTDYVLSPWLTAETTAQLKGLGKELKTMLAGLLGGTQTTAQSGEDNFQSFVSSLQVGDEFFTVTLPSEVIFGLKGEDLTVKIGKTNGANGSRLSLISVANIYGNGGAEKTSLTIGIEANEVERPQPAFDNIVKLEGIASLLKTIAKSTTHLDEEIISGENVRHEYVLNRNFYIAGEILLNVSLINMDLRIKPVAFSITIDENGDVGVNVRFEYEAAKVIGLMTAINGNTVVDLTGKNGMVYMKRVQTTDDSKKPLAKPVTVYRAMPLSNFVSDMINQASFLFNLGDTIASALGSIDMSGSSGGEQTVQDIGTMFHKYIKTFEYSTDAAEKWMLILNGSGIMNGMNDVEIELGTDSEGALRDLSAQVGISASGISIGVSAALRFRNPCNVMDEGVKDITTEVDGILLKGMNQKLETVDWSSVKYLEGEYTSVDFVLAGTTLSTQFVVVSTGAEGNDPAGTLYGKLDYPKIPAAYELPGYKIEWKTKIGENGKLPSNRIIEAEYVPLSFNLTFTSDKEAEGYIFDEELGLWVLKTDYRYGEAFEFPFTETLSERIVYFEDEAGNRYFSLDNWTMDGTVFRAVWEQIVYSATFEVNGEEIVVTGHYGDSVKFPEAEAKEGYNFVGWTINGVSVNELTLTQNVMIKAEFEPVTVIVTLLSNEPANGFELADGKYVKKIAVTYGAGALELPTERNSGFALVAFSDEAGNRYFRVENLTEELTLYAVWEELGYTVTFLAEDNSVVKTLNAKAGEQISTRVDLPAVPFKKGYTGSWNFGGDTVSGDMTIRASYTANVYTVTVVSEFPYNGFTEGAGRFEKQYRYVYDGDEITLNSIDDISGYWFKGFFTEKDGKGEKLTAVGGITEDTTLYVWWQDNTVTVRLYSDLRLENSTFDPQKNGYYVEKSYNNKYEIEYAPVLSGYQQLGWWYEEDGAWSPINNVQRFHGQNSVSIWAVWIQNIDVEITDFSVNRTNIGITGTITYNIMGAFTGGSVVAGKSSEIFPNAPERSVQFVVYYNNGRDGLSGGDEIVIEGNTFRKLKMTCGSAGSTWNTAPYGGARITHTFTYADANGNLIPVSTQDENCISLETYRYQFYNEAGKVCDTVDIRGVYGQTVALGDFLPAVPEKEGHTGKWLIDAATIVDSGNRGSVETSGINDIVTLYTTDVKPSYQVNSYTVRLESEQFVEGWTQVNGKYVYACDANYGATVTVYCDNKVIASYAVGVKNNVFALPALENNYVWGSMEFTDSSIKCYAQRNVDTVLYSSEIAFEHEGVLYNGFSEELCENYELIVPECAGYTFLGWYSKYDGGWEKVTSLQGGSGSTLYNLQALWISDLNVTLSGVKRSGLINAKYSATASVSGGELIGAFANEAQVSTRYTFFVNDGATDTDADNRGYVVVDAEEEVYKDSYSFSDVKKDKKSYLHVAAQVTYMFGGETFTAGEVVSSSSKF